MYADDLILLSISLLHLQLLVNLCQLEFHKLGLEINHSKSMCMRLGDRHKITPCNIKVNGVDIAWTNEVNYLGIQLLTGKSFNFNFQILRQKFFRAVNCIFGRIEWF